MLSQKSKYALKALTILAKEYGQGPVLISDVAQREEIPRKFLEIILLELKNAGILQSKKGKGGGYSLGRPPQQITLDRPRTARMSAPARSTAALSTPIEC